MITITSPTLLTEMRHGEPHAWTEFHRRYSPMLMAIAKRRRLSDDDALDVVQETLVAVFGEFQKLGGSFDRSERPFKAWLKTIVAHKLGQFFRNEGRWARRIGALAEAGPTGRAVPCLDGYFEQEWQRGLIDRAVREVVHQSGKPEDFQIFEMLVQHGHPTKRVAKVMGMSVNAVYVRKSRFIRNLRSTIERIRREEEGL